jgi:hypothetical protein
LRIADVVRDRFVQDVGWGCRDLGQLVSSCGDWLLLSFTQLSAARGKPDRLGHREPTIYYRRLEFW